MNARDRTILRATAVATGVSAGIFFTFSTFVMPALNAVDHTRAIDVMQQINEKAPNPALVLVLFGPVLTLPWLAFRARGTGEAGLIALGAGVYLVGVIGVSIAGSFPLNDTLATVHVRDAAQAAHEWHHYTRAWNPLNHIRTLTGIVSTALLVTALRKPRPAHAKRRAVVAAYDQAA